MTHRYPYIIYPWFRRKMLQSRDTANVFTIDGFIPSSKISSWPELVLFNGLEFSLVLKDIVKVLNIDQDLKFLKKISVHSEHVKHSLSLPMVFKL